MGIAQIIQVIFVIGVGLLQHNPLLHVLGVRPNLVLASLVAFSLCVREWRHYLIMLIAGLAILRFQDSPEQEIITLGLIAFAAFLVRTHLPWRSIFNNGALIAAGTIGFYLAVQPSFLYAHGPAPVFIELFMNLVAGTIIFLSFNVQKDAI